MSEVYIVSGCRTPIGAFAGSLKEKSAIELGAIAISESLRKAGLRPKPETDTPAFSKQPLKSHELTQVEEQFNQWDGSDPEVIVDEVIMGNVLQAGQGQNPARQAMIQAGLYKETPAYTINKVCGSGLKAIAMGASAIMTGNAEVVIAGGMESMSNVPMALPKARWGHRMELTGTGDIYDLLVYDGLYEIFYGYHMGITAENIAKQYRISRQEQDELAVLSHQRAIQAVKQGIFAEEIIPVPITSRHGERIISEDERPLETNLESMSKLQPVFEIDGSVTAGNASGINDGAAAVLLMSREKAEEFSLTPMAKITRWASGGVDPAFMGLGPVPAIKKILAKQRLSLDDIELIELNEAFAAQAIGCMKELDLVQEKPNELGSGISLGHPIGCTGARQLVTGVHQMRRKNYQRGLISMCIGGGMGMAMLIEH